jgi:hypothetical protein
MIISPNKVPFVWLFGVMWLIGMNPLGHADAAGGMPPEMQLCGECHMVYPANMLPQRSWQAILSTLDQHFGENAALSAKDVASITDYLINYASDSPTLAPRERHFLSELTPDSAPLRITLTRWWNQMHADFDFEGIKNTPVKSASNCLACHLNGVK